MRFAIWCAVSTREQAASDKLSLATQQERCRQAGLEHGWQEAGLFIVPGQSRTKYLTLEAATRAIPALRNMLDAARNGRFDVLIMTEYDRLRELLDAVFRTLAAYHVQLVSLAQWIDPVPRELYDQYSSDSVALTIGLSTIISRADISRLRRKWREQMPLRVTERGLPMHISWGYRKPPGQEDSRKAIPEQNPELVRHLLKMRDMLLEGLSIRQIIEYLEEHQVPPPRSPHWHPQTVRDILRNPFYAGWVRFGVSRVYLDPEGQRRRNRQIPADEIHKGRGKHIPLWDDQTQQLLSAELRRRSTHYRGRKNNQFTGLVKCKCGAAMWRQENGPRSDRLIWRCSQNKTHSPITHSRLVELVGAELVEAFKQILDKLPQPQRPEDPQARLQASRSELNKQLERLEIAYLAGEMTLDRYALHKARLASSIADVDGELALVHQAAAERERIAQGIRWLSVIDEVPEWLCGEDPVKVNHILHFVLEKIILNGEAIELVPAG